MSYTQEATNGELVRCAIVDGNLEEVCRLLQDQDVNREVKAGWTSLHYACQSGQDHIVSYLLENGADVNRDAELFTPLMAACSVQDCSEDKLLKCVKLLLEHKAVVDVMDRYKFTAFLYACKSGHENIVSLLLDSKSDVNQTDNEGRSALWYAVIGNYPRIVQLLLDKGANADLQDRWGANALSIAYQKDLSEIVAMLEKPDTLEIVECIEEKKSSFELLLSELPSFNSSDGRSGFPSDVENLLSGVGLEHFRTLFSKNNIQLAKYLNVTHQELKEIGVKLSFHRGKMMQGNFRFIQHPWNPNVLPPMHNNAKILDVVRGLANIVKQLHILWASTLYCTERVIVNSDSQNVETLYQVSRRAVGQANTILEELKAIRYYAQKMAKHQNCSPADLILPKKASHRNGFKKFIVITLLFGTGIVAWKSKILKFVI